MATSLSDFLLELSNDPDKLAQYKEDSETVLASSGLSDEDQEVMRSNDPQRIRDALGITAQVVVVVVVIKA